MIKTISQFMFWVAIILALSASPFSDSVILIAIGMMGIGIANGMKEVAR